MESPFQSYQQTVKGTTPTPMDAQTFSIRVPPQPCPDLPLCTVCHRNRCLIPSRRQQQLLARIESATALLGHQEQQAEDLDLHSLCKISTHFKIPFHSLDARGQGRG